MPPVIRKEEEIHTRVAERAPLINRTTALSRRLSRGIGRDHRVVPREAAERTPSPPAEVGHVKISDTGEIDKEFAALISARTMLGGGRLPGGGHC